MLSFLQEKKKTGLFKYNFPFSLAKVNKLTCYEEIYLYLGEDNFFVFTKNDTDVHQWKNRDVTFSLFLKKYISVSLLLFFIIRTILKHPMI